MDTDLNLIKACDEWLASYDRADDGLEESAWDIITKTRDDLMFQSRLMDAVLLALPVNPADELRRISGPGTTISLAGADCRNVVRNLANVIDGTWKTVPRSAVEAFIMASEDRLFAQDSK